MTKDLFDIADVGMIYSLDIMFNILQHYFAQFVYRVQRGNAPTGIEPHCHNAVECLAIVYYVSSIYRMLYG